MGRDFVEMLSALSTENTEYLVVGAFAVTVHGLVRSTSDLDVWVNPSRENAPRVVRALTAFGAPLFGLTEADFANPGKVLQIGVPPLRIDILTGISGVTFDKAWPNRIHADFGPVRAAVIGWRDLITNKRASGRPKDLLDADWLEAHPEPPASS